MWKQTVLEDFVASLESHITAYEKQYSVEAE